MAKLRLVLAALGSFLLPLLSSDGSSPSKEMISVTATSEPSSFVNNVNTIFGNLLLTSTDLSAEGPNTLPIVRYYNSRLSSATWLSGIGMAANYPLWVRGLPLHADVSKYAYMMADEVGGSVVCCAAKMDDTKMKFYLDPDTIHYGLTNAAGEISARTNWKNMEYVADFYWEDSKHDGRYLKAHWKAKLCNGGEREYHSTEWFEDAMNIKNERRPNGTKLSFEYHGGSDDLGYLKEITLKNHSHQHTLGWLRVEYEHKHKKVCVTSSTGKEITYVCAFHKDKKLGEPLYLEEVHSTDLPTIKYSYDEFHGRRYLSKISRPDGRYLTIDYDDEGRVTKQKAPVGEGGEEKTICTFFYHPKDRRTEVRDARWLKTVFRYSSRDRLTQIEKFLRNDKLYRGSEFFWGKKESLKRGERDDSDEGHLLAKTVYDGDKRAIASECYTYDSHGNIKEEKLYGNLTGGCSTRFHVSDEGYPKGHPIERYSKRYSYSHDHLVTCQQEDHGPKYTYEYQKDTDLLTARYTHDGQAITIREFFEYDSDAVLVKKIVDNGSSHDPNRLSGVTERRITYINPVRNRDDHGVGQPEEVSEHYIDMATGRDCRLKKSVFKYNKAGLVWREEVFDANNVSQYTLYTNYDSKNRPIKRTDALGRETIFAYDANSNVVREELLGSGVVSTCEYDKADRLVRKTDSHSDGVKVSTSYTYDAAGNVRSMTDPFGQTTTYTYDECNRRSSTTYPAVVDREGACTSSVERGEYDLSDSIAKHVDRNGHATTSTYTIRRQPVHISYPDGSSETYRYNLNGTLAKKQERDGSRKEYAYDFLGRLLSTTVFDRENHCLLSFSNTYDAFHCTSSTDPMGVKTFFQYDGAGRLSQVTKGRRITKYTYDSLGRRETTIEVIDGQHALQTTQAHDRLDRVTEVKKTLSDGTLLSLQRFAFDIRGNCTDTTSFSSEKVFKTVHTDFSTRNVPIRIVDALGNVTEITYDYAWRNELHQKVLRKETKDPLGTKTIEIYDALGRLDTVKKKSPENVLLAKTVFRYDSKGNKTQEREFVIVDGVVTREYVIEWAYTSMDQVDRMVEQPRTADEKVTSYTYTKGGLVKTIQKPDGGILTHTYDSLSRLITLKSSDGSVDYEYAYDLNNNPTSVIDHHLNISYTKSFDEFGNVLTETLLPNTSVAYAYDRLGRCTHYSVNDSLRVDYEYLGGHLRT